jgi:hypothetical protein
MALNDIIPSHYIILTPTVPVIPYALGDGHIVRAVKAEDDIFRGFSDCVPHRYGAVMALCNLGIPTYHTYRDLVIFHAFVTDDNETYEFGEIAPGKCQDDSNLTFIERYNSTLSGPLHPDRINEIDFNQFPIIIYRSTEDIIPGTPEPPFTSEQIRTLETDGILITETNPERRFINYNKAFALFRGLKSSRNPLNKKLYNLISLYIFAKSIKESREIYHNESAVIAFYIGILQSIAGDPPNCPEKTKCSQCGRTYSHHSISREQHMLNRFGYGFAEQTGIRGAFFHDGKFVDYTDAMFEVHDKIYLEGERTEETIRQSHELHELKEQIRKLGITVRKNLCELFLDQYEA